MGGRGSSSKRVGYRAPGQGQPQPGNGDGTQRITDPQQLLEFFKNADDEEADEMLKQWRAESLDPDNRQKDTDTQRFFNYIGWTSDTPEVLTEDQYQAAWQQAGQPTQIYHADEPYGGIGARQFALQYMGRGFAFNGEQYRHFLSGGIHGDGTYFARTADESASYGTSQFRGFLNSNAKVINESQLDSMWYSYQQQYPTLARVIGYMSTGYGGGWDGQKSVFAAMLGYNVIESSRHNGYLTVLNRKATTVSEKTVKAHLGMKDW